jgi:hypothetical protein
MQESTEVDPMGLDSKKRKESRREIEARTTSFNTAFHPEADK